MDGFTEALSDIPKLAKRNRPGSPDSSHSRSSSQSKNSLQDRLFTKYVWNGLFLGRSDKSVFLISDNRRLLEQVIPTDNEDENDSAGDKVFASPKKPAFSLPVMANNFRRFNAR